MDATGLPVRERRRRERRIWRNGLLVSLALHLLLFLGFGSREVPPSPFSAAGPKAGDDRAAAGGMQAVTLRTPTTRTLRPPPTPLLTEVEVEPVEYDLEPSFDQASILGDQPGPPGPGGLPDGTGRGDGGTAAEGRFTVVPPVPRGMIIPPTNRDLRGVEVQVWVFVDPSGRVVADSTWLNPPTRDGSFNRQLIREAAEWVFRPAEEPGGAKVAAWFPYTITM